MTMSLEIGHGVAVCPEYSPIRLISIHGLRAMSYPTCMDTFMQDYAYFMHGKAFRRLIDGQNPTPGQIGLRSGWLVMVDLAER